MAGAKSAGATAPSLHAAVASAPAFNQLFILTLGVF